MHTDMKKLKNIFSLLVVALVGLSLTACSNDDLGTNQYQGGVSLNAYGPNPVMRGGQLRFVGSNLDQIASITIPGVGEITNIEVVKAGVPSEIRITVPKDGPQVGYVTLKTKTDQTITTKTQIEYIEGIEITKIPEETVMPGQTIRIEGDYLNLIYSLAFADGVLVSSSDFVEQDRYYIDVVVPEEAKSGKLELYTADLTIQRTKEEEDALTYQTIVSEDALTVGLPSTSKIASPRGEAEVEGEITAKAGETITLTGSYYNVISAIKFGEVEITEFEVSKDGTTLTFTLPAEAPSGIFSLVCKSEEEVPVATLVTVKPSNGVAAPNPVKAGSELTISGQDMDVVTAVQFEGADALSGDKITVAADKVVVGAVPETATEGKLKLVMANGESVEVAFTLVKPAVTAYNANPVSAGAELQITGTDLDLVKSVTFGEATNADDKFEVSADGTTITVTVPMEGTSGKPKLNLANGTSVEALDLSIEEAVFCYATALPGDDVELKAGNSLTLTVANGDKLTGVQIDGNNCQYVLVNGNSELIIGVPDKAKKGSKVRLISSNGEITYTIDFIPNTEVTTVLWSGALDLGSWSINWQVGDGTAGANNPKMFVDMDLQEGDVIRIYATPTNDWWQIQFFDGHWGGQTEIGNATGLNNGNNIKADIYNLEEHDGCIEIPVTAELLSQLTTLTDWGYCWIIQGENLVITKIAVTHYTVLEQTLWAGDLDFGSWAINWQVGDGTAGANNPQMFVDAELKAGMTLRLYITPTNDWWQVQFFDGHWGGQTEIGIATGLNNGNNVNPNIYNLDEHNGAIEIPVTAALAEQLTTLTDWGYCWILQGENCRATKITVE